MTRSRRVAPGAMLVVLGLALAVAAWSGGPRRAAVTAAGVGKLPPSPARLHAVAALPVFHPPARRVAPRPRHRVARAVPPPVTTGPAITAAHTATVAPAITAAPTVTAAPIATAAPTTYVRPTVPSVPTGSPARRPSATFDSSGGFDSSG